MRLATMMMSVMSWIIVRRRAFDGSSDSTPSGCPWKGNARSSVVRTRSSDLEDPSVATTTALTGRRAAFAADRCADGQAVDDACELCPRTFERK